MAVVINDFVALAEAPASTVATPVAPARSDSPPPAAQTRAMGAALHDWLERSLRCWAH